MLYGIEIIVNHIIYDLVYIITTHVHPDKNLSCALIHPRNEFLIRDLLCYECRLTESQLDEYLVDGAVQIRILLQPFHKQKLETGLTELRSHYDLTVLCKRESYSEHKCVLGSRSPVLREWLLSHPSEKVLKMDGYSTNVVSRFLA